MLKLELMLYEARLMLDEARPAFVKRHYAKAAPKRHANNFIMQTHFLLSDYSQRK